LRQAIKDVWIESMIMMPALNNSKGNNPKHPRWYSATRNVGSSSCHSSICSAG